MHVVFIYKPGPKWIKHKSIFEQPLDEHISYMNKLGRAGTLRLGGPFTDSSGTIGILRATLSEAENLIANDPAIRHQIMSAELHPWSASVAKAI